MQAEVSKSIGSAVARIRAHSPLPVAVGFGISNPEQARQVAADSEAIVVGSAVVNRIATLGRSPTMVAEVAAFVKSLSDAILSKS
jgi:tryptophan synthase alpha chain